MSNRGRLRPSICRAVGSDGKLLVKAATYRDPGAYVPSPPHLVRGTREPKRNRPPSGTPEDEYARFARYASQNDRSNPDRGLLTPRQARRWKQKLHAQRRREASPA